MISRDVKIFGGILVVAFLALGIFSGLIGISYPVRVYNTALTSPVKVKRIIGHQIELVDGRLITLSDDEEWKTQIAYSKNWVDLEGDPEGPEVWVYGDRKFMLCGTPWAQPIRIPIIPNRIPMNHRQLIAVGEITKTAEQAGTGQPATRPESKSEGGDKPQPEAEGRSR